MKRRLKIAVVCLALGNCGRLCAFQIGTREQLNRVDWQPTQTIAGARYAGSEACAECHPDLVQQSSPMAHGLERPADSAVLRLHPQLAVSNGPYRYTVKRQEGGISYEVTDGVRTISLPVSWAFGQGVGEVGQTYLLHYLGSYYESRVTFYSGIQALDITLGHPATAPSSLEEAIGRLVKPVELRACFGCHSTGAVSGERLQIEKLTPGVTCEGCHGPGAEHVAAAKAGKPREGPIFNPASLTPGDLVRFCGACHRTRAHTEALHLTGIVTVRFQSYRLAESRCFDPRDRRISCLACHDPHRTPQPQPAFYDSKCLACHRRGAQARRHAVSCRRATSRCVVCHMPKYMLAGSHFRFTDHRIRVVRLGDTFD